MKYFNTMTNNATPNEIVYVEEIASLYLLYYEYYAILRKYPLIWKDARIAFYDSYLMQYK